MNAKAALLVGERKATPVCKALCCVPCSNCPCALCCVPCSRHPRALCSAAASRVCKALCCVPWAVSLRLWHPEVHLLLPSYLEVSLPNFTFHNFKPMYSWSQRLFSFELKKRVRVWVFSKLKNKHKDKRFTVLYFLLSFQDLHSPSSPAKHCRQGIDNTLQTSDQKQCDKEKDKGHRLVAKPFSGEQWSSCSEKKKQQWPVSGKGLEDSSGLA